MKVNIKRIIPFLNEDDIQKLAIKIIDSPNGKFQGVRIDTILPFVDNADELFFAALDKGEERSLKPYLPYISKEAYHKLICGCIDGIYDVDLDYVYPFLPEEDLKLLLNTVFSKEKDFS